MKRMWLLGTALLTVLVMAIGGASLALFTADASNEDNTFVAGTLDIDANRDQGDGVPGPMYYFDTSGGGGTPPNQFPMGYLAPGDGGEDLHRVLQVENVGSLDARLIRIEGDLQSGSQYLADKLELVITTNPEATDVIYSGTVGDMITNGEDINIELPPGDIANLHFWVEFPRDADNSYQGLSAVVSFSVHAEQVANNP